MNVPVYNASGEKVGSQELNDTVFGVEFNDAVVHQVVTAQQSSGRQVLAHTKGRSEVQGGGRKPWKQKGTGRARHGSRRSPIWVGGGITFGPTKERNFNKRINKKMRQAAIRMVLSDKAKHDRLVIIDQWVETEGKTKKLTDSLSKLPSKDKKMTIITDKEDALVIRASKNVATIASLGVNSLNAVDLLKNEYLVLPKKAIAVIEKRYS